MILFFATGVGCKIEFVGATESTDILYDTIGLSVQSNWILKINLKVH